MIRQRQQLLCISLYMCLLFLRPVGSCLISYLFNVACRERDRDTTTRRWISSKVAGPGIAFTLSGCLWVRGEFISIPFFVLLLFPVIADLLVSNRISIYICYCFCICLSVCRFFRFFSFCVCFGRFFRGPTGMGEYIED